LWMVESCWIPDCLFEKSMRTQLLKRPSCTKFMAFISQASPNSVRFGIDSEVALVDGSNSEISTGWSSICTWNWTGGHLWFLGVEVGKYHQ
jgi:hypothetical protein